MKRHRSGIAYLYTIVRIETGQAYVGITIEPRKRGPETIDRMKRAALKVWAARRKKSNPLRVAQHH